MPDWVITAMGDCLRAGTVNHFVCNQLPRSTQPSIPPG